MAGALDLGFRRPLAADRGDVLSMSGSHDVAAWVERTLGHRPQDVALFTRALTHGSRGDDHYQRLEFLGDRVLGVIMATWLYEPFPEEPEGKLSRRFNAPVSREPCAEAGRSPGAGGQGAPGNRARDPAAP